MAPGIDSMAIVLFCKAGIALELPALTGNLR